MTDAVPGGYIPLREACKRYGLNFHQLYALYRRGVVRGHLGESCVLLEVASLEDWLPPPGWAWAHDALKEYLLPSHQLHALIKKGAVRARESGKRYQLELASLERALKARAEESQVPFGYLTLEEAGRWLGVTGRTAWRLVRAGQLRGRKHGRKVIVEEASLEELRPPGWVKLSEAATRTGRPVATVYAWARQGKVRARKAGGRWIVEERSLEEVDRSAGRRVRGPYAKGTKPRMKKEVPPGWVKVQEAARRLGLSVWSVRRRVRSGRLRARRDGHRWLVAEDLAELELFPGWITARRAAERLGVSMWTLRRRLQAAKLPARKVGGRWIVEEAALGASEENRGGAGE